MEEFLSQDNGWLGVQHIPHFDSTSWQTDPSLNMSPSSLWMSFCHFLEGPMRMSLYFLHTSLNFTYIRSDIKSSSKFAFFRRLKIDPETPLYLYSSKDSEFTGTFDVTPK